MEAVGVQGFLRVWVIPADLADDRLDIVKRGDAVAGDIVEQRGDILARQQAAQLRNGPQHGRVNRHAAGDRIALPHLAGGAAIGQYGFPQGDELLRRHDIGDGDEAVTVESLAPFGAHLARQPPPPPAAHGIRQSHARDMQPALVEAA